MSAPWRALERLPRAGLGILPTPLVSAPRLGAAIGLPRLWVKHDELLGFGFGGNKIRALDLILADALASGADALVTGAGPQSNYVRAAAAAAARAGLPMHAVYWGAPPEPSSVSHAGNFGLTRLLGARLHFTGSADRASVDGAIEAVAAELRAAGGRPYPIPRGGACALGLLGHVLGAGELHAQLEAAELEPSALLLAVGSGSTLGGWALGRNLLGARWRIDGVPVSRPAAESAARVLALGAEAAARIGAAPLDDGDFQLHDGFLGEGYGVPSPAGVEAITLAARTEGLFLDPTYTGKAFAALRHLAATGALPADRPVVFLHTGGEPSLFASGVLS